VVCLLFPGVPIPFINRKVTDSEVKGDASRIIQDAIDHVSHLPLDTDGFRGAVVIEAGNYEVSTPLNIITGGVVLRGQGSSFQNGTTITFTSTIRQSSLFNFGNYMGYTEANSSTVVDVIDSFVPVGAKNLTVSNANGFSVGETIIIELRPNQDWLDHMSKMGQYGW
jgi:hypothetical protein